MVPPSFLPTQMRNWTLTLTSESAFYIISRSQSIAVTAVIVCRERINERAVKVIVSFLSWLSVKDDHNNDSGGCSEEQRLRLISGVFEGV